MQATSKQKKLYLAAFAALLLSIGALLIKDGVFCYHDTQFHILRLEYLVEAIKQGDLYPVMYPDAYGGYGYAIPLFYCNFTLYIPALFVLAGVPIFAAYELYILLHAAAVLGVCYYAVNRFLGSSLIACLAALLYTGSAYFAADLMVRGAMGECDAFIFAPLALLGIYYSVYGNERRNWALVLGFLGLALSHLLSLAIFAGFYLAFLLINIKRIVKEPSRLLKIALGALAVLALGSFYLLPLIEQLLTTKFYSAYHASIFKPITAAVGVRNLFVTLSDEPIYEAPFGLTMLFLMLLRFAFPLRPKDDKERFRDLCLLGGCACLFIATRFFPWEALDPYANIIQFPWRFFLPGTVFVTFAGAIMLNEKLKGKSERTKTLAVLVTAALCIAQYMLVALPEYYYHQQDVRKSRFSGIIYSLDELELVDENYLHINTDEQFWDNRKGLAYPLKGELHYEISRDYKVTTFKYSGNSCDNSVELPLVYFLGYSAADQDGTPLPLSVSDRGMLQMDVGSEQSGVVKIEYTGTAIKRASPYVTLAAVLAAAAIAAFDRKQKQRKI